MEKYKEIGHRLKLLRANLSQEEFAMKLRLHVRTYINYELGKRTPKGDVLYRISAITGKPVDWILGGDRAYESNDEAIREEVRRIAWKEGETLSPEMEVLLMKTYKSARHATPAGEVREPGVEYFPSDPTFQLLVRKFRVIYNEGDKRQRGDIRGLIEETYDEIRSKKPDMAIKEDEGAASDRDIA